MDIVKNSTESEDLKCSLVSIWTAEWGAGMEKWKTAHSKVGILWIRSVRMTRMKELWRCHLESSLDLDDQHRLRKKDQEIKSTTKKRWFLTKDLLEGHEGPVRARTIAWISGFQGELCCSEQWEFWALVKIEAPTYFCGGQFRGLFHFGACVTQWMKIQVKKRDGLSWARSS